VNDSSSEPDLLNDLAHEFAERYRRGERPGLTEYTARHPELAAEIRELFPAMALMEQFGTVDGPATGPQCRAATEDGSPLRQLGEYRILREIARGGMGIVYEAVQESLGRHVALKVLAFQGLLHPNYLERFQREARAAAQLHHTNIVPVFGVGEDNGVHYFAMQFIQGQSLDSVLAELKRSRNKEIAPPPGNRSANAEQALSVAQALLTGRFPAAGVPAVAGVQASPEALALNAGGSPPDLSGDPTGERNSSTSAILNQSEAQYFRSVVQVGIQVAEALAYAHQQGVLHRDIKPANLLLDTRGTVWVTDFGLAKGAGVDQLTSPGDIVGTIRYMAPERFRGQGDQRSDVFSLGLTLYELATLRPAFTASERAQLIERILHEESPQPSKVCAQLPRDLETIILKATAKDPGQRYPSAAALAEDLQRFLADRPIRARRSGMWEHAWRWCRRNRLVASLAGLLAVVLVGGGVGGVIGAYHFRSLALQADEAKKEAEDKARQIQESMERQNRAYQLLERGQVYSSRGSFDRALADFTEAATLRPDLAGVWLARASIYEALRLYEPAAQDYGRAFQLHRSPELSVWWSYAALHLYVRDLRGYNQTCSEMVKHFGTKMVPRNSWWLAETFTLGAKNGIDPEFTVELAKRALANDPRSSSYTWTMAAAQYRAGRVAAALRSLQELARPGTTRAHADAEPLLAMVHARLGHREEARFWMKRARQTFDRHLWAMRRRPLDWAYEYFDFGNHDLLKLILLYREARELIPETPPTEEVLCDILEARSRAYLGQLAAAERGFTMAIKRQPKNALLRLLRGVFWGQQAQWARALADFDQANALRPLDDQWELGCRAVMHLRQGAADAYAETCRQMMKRFGQTDDPKLATFIAWMCSLAPGAIKDASAPVRLAELSLKGNPQDAWCALALGAALYRAGQYQQAASHLRQAMKGSANKNIQQDIALAQLFLGMALQRLGESKEAARLLNSASDSIDRATAGEGKSKLGPGWWVWAACQVVRPEAQTLISGRATRLPK
jgi:serine/threonine protein kinase/Flp pilus assembly protein TadD